MAERRVADELAQVVPWRGRLVEARLVERVVDERGQDEQADGHHDQMQPFQVDARMFEEVEIIQGQEVP